jgi:hypothetical protein
LEGSFIMPGGDTDLVIPPALAAEIQAAAEAEHRTAADLVKDALERYLTDRRERTSYTREEARPTSAEAATRLRELREGNVLPDGMTIRDLMTHGRA